MALLHQVGLVEIFAKNRYFQYVEKFFLDKLASIPRYIGKFNDLPISRGILANKSRTDIPRHLDSSTYWPSLFGNLEFFVFHSLLFHGP